jgi:CubicO group peptidase (beta-lactamase class C family)
MVRTELFPSTAQRSRRGYSTSAARFRDATATPRVRSSSLLGALLLALFAALPAEAQRRGDPLRGLDDYIERARRDWGVAGLSVAIVKDDAVVYAKGFGLRENGRAERVDEHTIFAIGSNTKAFTAAGVGLLVEAGRMSWDDPVTKHLPEFQLFDPYATREMTLRDVLSHRSGLARGDAVWYGMPYDRAEVIRRVRYLEPSTSFRSRYGYQNIMFIAAGEALARAAGVSWDDFTQARLLQPLGMSRSTTSTLPLAAQQNVATPHSRSPDGARPIAWRNIDNAGPAGSINSSAFEMTHWLRAILNGGTLDGRRVLAEATVRELQRPHTISAFAEDTIFPMTNFSTYGLGFGLRDYYGRKVVAHTGGIDGMLSYVTMVPRERLGIVVLTNTDGANVGSAIVNRVLDAYLGGEPRDWNETFLRLDRAARVRADSAEQALVARRAAGTRPSLELARYAGTYESTLYGPVTIALQNGALVLRRQDGPAVTLEHWHYDTFRPAEPLTGIGRAFVRFMLDARARVQTLDVAGLGEFRRVEPAAGATR